MPVTTNNAYGEISISNLAIAKVARNVAMECYGVVDTVAKGLVNSFMVHLRSREGAKGVKVETEGDRITISVNVILKYGVSIVAVAESLKSSIKYNVEKFTGMIVDAVNVNVVGVRL